LFYRPAISDLIDFRMDNRGVHDITVCMMMAELGDNELMDKPVEREQRPIELQDEYGYFTTVKNGKQVKEWGKIPDKNRQKMKFDQKDPIPDLVDLRRQKK